MQVISKHKFKDIKDSDDKDPEWFGFKHMLSNAINLRSLNKILFYFHNRNYILDYSEKKPYFDTTCSIHFDIDDGFLMNGDPLFNDVSTELNKHFTRWKENNYEGAVIPESQSGFNYEPKTINYDTQKNPGEEKYTPAKSNITTAKYDFINDKSLPLTVKIGMFKKTIDDTNIKNYSINSNHPKLSYAKH